MAGFEDDRGVRDDDPTFYRRLARHAGLQFVLLEPEATGDPDFTEINPLAARLLTEELCRHFHMLPIAYRDGVVAVAFCDPFDQLANELATALTAAEVQPVLAEPGDVEQAIARIFGPLRTPHFEDLGPAPHESPRVGDLLVANGAATDEQVEAALREQERTGSRLGEVLLHSGAIRETDLIDALVEQFQLPALDIEGGHIDADVVKTIPEPVARELRLAPVAADETTLYVAVVDPIDAATVERLREYTDKEIVGFLAPLSQVDEILEATYREDYSYLATDDLRERSPENCALRVVTPGQKMFLVVMTVVIVVGFVLAPRGTAVALVGLASVFYLAASLYKFRLIYRALGNPYEVETSDDEIDALDELTLPVYSILVPLYKEAGVLPALVSAIEDMNYPKTKLDVLLLCEDDDDETVLAIEAMDLPPHFRLIVVPESQPKTKPKACNYGLMLARGDITVIFDAEDRPDPDQLKKVVVAFSKSHPKVTCVQAKLSYYNPDQNLLTRWFTTEYSMWFELLLPGLDADGAPIPLGGTSNHFLTARLRELGAWDPFNVTEDADLGIRLHRAGFRTAMVDSTTLEEANSDVKNWIRQRSRWIKGYIQTYLVHMRNPLLLMRQAGFRGFLSFQLLIGGTFIFLLNPIFWALTTMFFFTHAGFIQAMFPTFIFYLAAFMLFVGNFVFLYLNVAGSIQKGLFGLAKYALISPLYWGLMSIAAWKGFIQLITNPFYWEKTEHGLHAPAAGPAAPRVPQGGGGAPPVPPGQAAGDPQVAAAPERELATTGGGR
ncbi:MAG: glycosyltransferase XagB [Solirubrobacteraceae bacterium]|jgi:cellulose synthase/poly-beta-1,6-N-acetylglucosamine synthase-like glycosyltransferase|nr:glycosyltransferase XagB [Solirubrobacteraceae bacterium]MEA2189837.1 glycosyltransferase XagB [Solirubrobacteraceae bacterium]